jgi:hypothetical protein
VAFDYLSAEREGSQSGLERTYRRFLIFPARDAAFFEMEVHQISSRMAVKATVSVKMHVLGWSGTW